MLVPNKCIYVESNRILYPFKFGGIYNYILNDNGIYHVKSYFFGNKSFESYFMDLQKYREKLIKDILDD